MSALEYIQQAIAALDWEREPRGLYEPVAYTLQAGGKRLRPALAVIASDMFGGRREEVLPAALALEVFHNFTLLHDDVMDKAPIRRGRPTVHVRWNENTAILSGDQMLIEAYRLLTEVPAGKLPAVLRLFNRMATGICEGQQYDMDFERRDDVTLDEYINMIRLKTSVLLANALQTGALIAGAPEETQQALYRYGICIGLAFQLQDDILDVYGDPATFGKAIGGDILEGKKTYMLLTALQQAEGEDREQLLRLLGDRHADPQKKISDVTAIYTRLGVRRTCEEVMKNYTQQALAELDLIDLPHERKLILINLAEKLLARTE
ncbi:MAG: polyprenyl synthetase family protein [Paludibacteraceae bacterium]|nr:polyprenyl synthetase family protein [Paludibacteraceae bacterium]MBQ9704710.1 polyprenyl synthetase family protein [Paludibacteraceae bacterium]